EALLGLRRSPQPVSLSRSETPAPSTFHVYLETQNIKWLREKRKLSQYEANEIITFIVQSIYDRLDRLEISPYQLFQDYKSIRFNLPAEGFNAEAINAFVQSVNDEVSRNVEQRTNGKKAPKVWVAAGLSKVDTKSAAIGSRFSSDHLSF